MPDYDEDLVHEDDGGDHGADAMRDARALLLAQEIRQDEGRYRRAKAALVRLAETIKGKLHE
jgi:hypothetical protein